MAWKMYCFCVWFAVRHTERRPPFPPARPLAVHRPPPPRQNRFFAAAADDGRTTIFGQHGNTRPSPHRAVGRPREVLVVVTPPANRIVANPFDFARRRRSPLVWFALGRRWTRATSLWPPPSPPRISGRHINAITKCCSFPYYVECVVSLGCGTVYNDILLSLLSLKQTTTERWLDRRSSGEIPPTCNGARSLIVRQFSPVDLAFYPRQPFNSGILPRHVCVSVNPCFHLGRWRLGSVICIVCSHGYDLLLLHVSV